MYADDFCFYLTDDVLARHRASGAIDARSVRRNRTTARWRGRCARHARPGWWSETIARDAGEVYALRQTPTGFIAMYSSAAERPHRIRGARGSGLWSKLGAE
jgi:hypothetical protein